MYELQYHAFKNYLIKSLLVGKFLQVLKWKVKFSVRLTCNKQAYQLFNP